MQGRARRLADGEPVEALEVAEQLVPDRQARLVVDPLDQGEPARERRLVGADERRGVGEQLQARAVGQAGPARRQRVEQRRGIADAEEADVVGVDDQRRGAIVVADDGGARFAQEQVLARAGADAAELHRHVPAPLARARRAARRQGRETAAGERRCDAGRRRTAHRRRGAESPAASSSPRRSPRPACRTRRRARTTGRRWWCSRTGAASGRRGCRRGTPPRRARPRACAGSRCPCRR